MSTVPAFGACATVLRRDNWACACCGTAIAGRPFSVRYRSPGWGDSPANLLTFLGDGKRQDDPADHSARVDFRRDQRDEAKGYSLRSGQNPLLVPVTIFSPDGPGMLLWLSDDGRYLPAAPEEAAA